MLIINIFKATNCVISEFPPKPSKNPNAQAGFNDKRVFEKTKLKEQVEGEAMSV